MDGKKSGKPNAVNLSIPQESHVKQCQLLIRLTETSLTEKRHFTFQEKGQNLVQTIGDPLNLSDLLPPPQIRHPSSDESVEGSARVF